jgi:hypothetical protein
MTIVSVIIPTVEGREVDFERCIGAYLDRSANNVQIIVERDHPSCGLAWQAGLKHVEGDYVHLTCDDIEPLEGWDVPAVEACDQGFLPCPQVCDPAGNPQSAPQTGVLGADWTPSPMTALPFCSAVQLEKIVPLFTAHYYTDDFFGWRGVRAGWPLRVRSGYRFTHHWAQHKRGAGMSERDRMSHDLQLYLRAQAMVEAGTWIDPWPREGI